MSLSQALNQFAQNLGRYRSIKLRIMSELTEKNGDKPASLYWKERAYKAHEEEMLGHLKKACNIE